MRHPVELRDRAVLMVGEIRADHESGRAGTTTVATVHADNDGVLGVRKVWLRLNREREADAGPTARRTVERPRDELGQAVAARGKPRALPSTTRPRRAHTQTLSWKSLNIDTAVGAVVGAATGALGKVAAPLLSKAGTTITNAARTAASRAAPAARQAATTVTRAASNTARAALRSDTGTAERASDGVSLSLKHKDGWTAAQRSAADAKVAALSNEELSVTAVQRAGTSAASRYRFAGGTIPRGADVDHVVDLQLGGADDILDMNPLDASVDRSLGAQIAHRIRGLQPGTRICSMSICER